ncbi:hypothetical protein BDZ94DRAFT_1313557 [Collybia nuda]|uniref:Uncharacterized protein n=1 Tax=Collybia nuda TaxID=64659 RepID=A0A9P5XYV1_9AGAR|nr:hypothetical protein BDZ94DRAFT_1313557 [Collybia nuda]
MSSLFSHQTQVSKNVMSLNGWSNLIDPTHMFKYSSKQYDILASHFNTYVTISIFTVATIIALLAVLHDATDLSGGGRNTDEICFMTGELLCMVVMAIHVGIIVIGGRSWTLCVRLVADSDEAKPVNFDFGSSWSSVAPYRGIAFYQYAVYCEQAQYIATTIFLASVLLMGFSIFSGKALPIVFLGFVTFLELSVYFTGCWQVSRDKAVV